MTIQRLYSLPNCTLVLEGFSTHTAQVERPLLDVLIRFECQLTGSQKSLTGGRDLLENLAAAASQFAQEYLSGVRRTGGNAKGHAPVQLKTVDPHSCRLLVQPELLVGESAAAPNSSSQPALPIELSLSTVQVFDLVEAFDQLFADTQTLPDLSLDFLPISKRESTSRQPVTERAAPVALGVTSLALATVALFLIPIPKVEKPRPTPQRTPSQPEQNQPLPDGIPNPRQSSSSEAPTLAIAPYKLELQQKLYTLIDQAWKTRPAFDRDVVYRVGTDQNAKITGYWFENQAAIDYADEVPLLDLLNLPLSGQSAQQPSAQFQVVFTSTGALQVSPWSNLGSPPQKISGKAALR